MTRKGHLSALLKPDANQDAPTGIGAAILGSRDACNRGRRAAPLSGRRAKDRENNLKKPNFPSYISYLLIIVGIFLFCGVIFLILAFDSWGQGA